jgi:hypothetical protein
MSHASISLYVDRGDVRQVQVWRLPPQLDLDDRPTAARPFFLQLDARDISVAMTGSIPELRALLTAGLGLLERADPASESSQHYLVAWPPSDPSAPRPEPTETEAVPAAATRGGAR